MREKVVLLFITNIFLPFITGGGACNGVQPDSYFPDPNFDQINLDVVKFENLFASLLTRL